jgi:uncharacterized membrane protein HdeD (DUF308 family)
MSSNVQVFALSIEPAQLSKSELTGIRIAIAIGGICALVLGVLVLVWPESTLTLVAILLGLYFLISGAIRVVRGVFTAGATAGSRVLNIALGLLMVILGILAIKNPVNTLVALGLIIGICWIVEGVAALAETARDSSRWLGTLFAIVSLIAGIVVLLLPLESLAVLTVLTGLFLIATGILQLVQAFMLGRAVKA